MFISSLILYSAAAQTLGKLGIVDLMVNLFFWHAQELDIQAQCLFGFYRLVCHADTRTTLLTHPEVVEAVIRHSASRNAIVNGMANAVIDAIVTFDRHAAERLKLPRFDAFNQEWLTAIANSEAQSE
jgi:hypothetical protein